jgi:hypothetical protein
MFLMLAYAYATGLFESEEIVRACHSDRVLARLWQAEVNVPWARDVTEFRRKNRGTLIPVLKRLLRRVMEEHLGLEIGKLGEQWERQLEEDATERLDIARHMDASSI